MIVPRKSSIGFSGFEKLSFRVEISKISENIENLEKVEGALLLYELFEREPG